MVEKEVMRRLLCFVFRQYYFCEKFCNSSTLLMISFHQGKDQEGSVVIPSVSSCIAVL